MVLDPEESKFIEEQTKKLERGLCAPMIRMYSIIFGIGGWVVYEHWHIAPAVVAWTLAALFFVVSFKKEL